MSRSDVAALVLLRKHSLASFDMEDAILGSMDRTIKSLVARQRAMGLSFGSEVTLENGISITIDRQMYHRSWRQRFVQMAEMAQSIAQQYLLSACQVLRRLLLADGWVLNRFTLKSPAWMPTHGEVCVDQLPFEFGDFPWIRHL